MEAGRELLAAEGNTEGLGVKESFRRAAPLRPTPSYDDGSRPAPITFQPYGWMQWSNSVMLPAIDLSRERERTKAYIQMTPGAAARPRITQKPQYQISPSLPERAPSARHRCLDKVNDRKSGLHRPSSGPLAWSATGGRKPTRRLPSSSTDVACAMARISEAARLASGWGPQGKSLARR